MPQECGWELFAQGSGNYAYRHFRLAPDGTFAILRKLGRDPNADDGCYPTSLAAGQAGTLYNPT